MLSHIIIVGRGNKQVNSDCFLLTNRRLNNFCTLELMLLLLLLLRAVVPFRLTTLIAGVFTLSTCPIYVGLMS